MTGGVLPFVADDLETVYDLADEPERFLAKYTAFDEWLAANDSPARVSALPEGLPGSTRL